MKSLFGTRWERYFRNGNYIIMEFAKEAMTLTISCYDNKENKNLLEPDEENTCTNPADYNYIYNPPILEIIWDNEDNNNYGRYEVIETAGKFRLLGTGDTPKKNADNIYYKI